MKNFSKKKQILKLFSLALVSGGLLVACANNPSIKDVASYKNGTVKATDVYKVLKNNQQNQNIVKNFTILEVYGNVYGKDIKDSDVTTAFNNYKAKYKTEDAFKKAISSNGYTEDTLKDYLRKQLAYEYGVKKNITVSGSEIKKEWENYQPERKLKIMVFVDENTAKEAKNALDNGADFDKVAKEKSLSKIVDYTTRYNDEKLPKNVRAEIYKLKKDQVSNILTYTNTSNNQKIHYIVKVIYAPEKSKKLTPKLKKQLIEIIKNRKFSKGSETGKIVQKELANQNFKLLDNDYKKIFDGVINGQTSQSQSK